MVLQKCFEKNCQDWTPTSYSDIGSLSLSQIDLVDLLIFSKKEDVSPCETKTVFTYSTEQEYEIDKIRVQNKISRQPCFTHESALVPAWEIVCMLIILGDVRKKFPAWSLYEKNWWIHKAQILNINSIDEGIRESYRTAFQVVVNEKTEDEILCTTSALQDLINNLDLLKNSIISNTLQAFGGQVEFCDNINNGDSAYPVNNKLLHVSSPVYSSYDFFDSSIKIKINEKSSVSQKTKTEVLPHINSLNETLQVKFLNDTPANNYNEYYLYNSSQQAEDTKSTFDDTTSKISLDAIGLAETIHHNLQEQPFKLELKTSSYQPLCSDNSHNCRPKRERKRSTRYMNCLSYLSKNAKSSIWSEKKYNIKRVIGTNNKEGKEFNDKFTTVTTPFNDRSLPPAFQSGVKGVVWNRHRQVWEATWKSENGKRYWVSFRADKYGFEEAKRLAIQYRLKQTEDLENKRNYKKYQQPTNNDANEVNPLFCEKLNVFKKTETRQETTMYSDTIMNETTIKNSVKEQKSFDVNLVSGNLLMEKIETSENIENKNFSKSSKPVDNCKDDYGFPALGNTLNYDASSNFSVCTNTQSYIDQKIMARNTQLEEKDILHENSKSPVITEKNQTKDLNPLMSSVTADIKSKSCASTTKLNIRSNTGILGVCRDSMGRWYTAHISVNGKRKFARFMISEMGENEAKNYAIKARRLMENNEHFLR